MTALPCHYMCFTQSIAANGLRALCQCQGQSAQQPITVAVIDAH